MAGASEAALWREYARVALSVGSVPDAADMERISGRSGADLGEHRSELHAAVGRLALSVQAAHAGSSLGRAPAMDLQFDDGSQPWLPFGESRFASSQLVPELATRLGQRSELRFGVTIASQRYATPGFGEAHAYSDLGSVAPLGGSRGGFVEQSFGQGVRVGLESALGPSLSLGLSAQSRVDMDAFKTYRGIFTEPGDFDLPARAGVRLGWQATEPLKLSLGAERIFYSDVNAFTSAALPPRFLAFLGDGSSPNFAWRDLDVFSLRAELADTAGGQWGLQLTSRQQPAPTSTLLELALNEGGKGNHVSASYARAVSKSGRLAFAASYAPAQYLLGFSPVGNEYRDGSQLEVELKLSMGF